MNYTWYLSHAILVTTTHLMLYCQHIIHNNFYPHPSPSALNYVLSGGPCVGKTTLINYLKTMGFQTVPEAYGCIFEESREQGTLSTFFADPLELRQRLIAKQASLEASCNPARITLLDKGMVDHIIYADYFGVILPQALIDKASTSTYNSFVFFLEPLPENLYVLNDRRIEDRAQALKIHAALKNSYQRYGYTIIDIPFDTVERRAHYIVSFMQRLLRNSVAPHSCPS